MVTVREPVTTTVNDLMTTGAEHVGPSDSLVVVARVMRDLDVGALPIRDANGRLTGMVTDRDIVVRCIAGSGDPASMRASDLARGTPVMIESDQDAETALRTMARHQVRRLPVTEGGALVGIIAQADIARALPPETVGAVLAEVSEPD